MAFGQKRVVINHVEGLEAFGLQRLGAVRSGEDFETGEPQARRQQLADAGFVVDDEQPCLWDLVRHDPSLRPTAGSFLTARWGLGPDRGGYLGGADPPPARWWQGSAERLMTTGPVHATMVADDRSASFSHTIAR